MERLTRIAKMHIPDRILFCKIVRKRVFYVSFLRQTGDKKVWRRQSFCPNLVGRQGRDNIRAGTLNVRFRIPTDSKR
jgi:hypothetical protein